MENLTEIIRREAIGREMNLHSDFYRPSDFIKGASWMAEHMEKVLEWAAENFSREWDYGKQVWINYKDGGLLTTSQLIERYFQHIKKEG